MPQSTNDLHSDLAIVKSEVLHLRKDINHVLEILLYDTEQSITGRTKVLETKIESAQSDLDKIVEGAWQLRLALITSLIGFAGSLCVVFFEVFLKVK